MRDSGRIPRPQEDVPLLGTMTGVFTPAVLTILGAIMYLREGWMVGNAGLGGALLIILLAHVITISTALSVSSIATNTRLGAGGAYAIIAQSLGLEAGGSVGLPLYVARTASAVLYVLAFSEGWLRLFPDHPESLVAIVSFLVVFGVSVISTQFAQRMQVLLLVVVVVSLISFGLGAIPIAEATAVGPLEIKAQAGLVHTPVFWGTFQDEDFWTTFAIFFPAVTGIVAGISLSDVLAEPRKAIPHGTLWGVGLTMVVYLGLAYLLACIATPEELLENKTIMVDRALFGSAVLAGLAGATLSSALGSLVAAPRVLQALGAHRVIPASETFAKMSRGEPRNAMLATGALTFLTLVIALVGGGLDFVAPFITMFFLLTYAILNLVVFIEQTLDMVSFRPTFRIPRLIPFVGIVSSVFVMFLINPVFSLLAIVSSVGVFSYLLRRKLPGIKQGDVRSGLFLALAEWAANLVSALPAAPERTWQPNILAPVRSADELRGSYRLLRDVTRGGAVRTLGIYPAGERERVEGLVHLTRDLQRAGIFARATLLEQPGFVPGTQAAIELLSSATFFPPNILYFRMLPSDDLDELNQLIQVAGTEEMGIALLLPHPVVEFGQAEHINVWVRDQSPTWELGLRLGNDLSLLLAHELAKSWGGNMRLCMAVPNEIVRERAEEYLCNLIDLARLGQWASHHVLVGSFDEALQQVPTGDLTIFGLSQEPRMERIQWVREQVNGSCLLVRDSGNESVLA